MKWHIDNTLYDLLGRHVTLEMFHRRFIDMIQSGEIEDTEYSPLSSYLYVKTDRPRWLVSSEMARILADIPIDPDLSNIQWARDAMTLIFERGTVIDGIPFRWIRIFCPRSAQSKRVIWEGLKVEMTEKFCENLFLECDCGYGDDGLCREDRPQGQETVTSFRSIPLGEIVGEDRNFDLRAEEKPLHDKTMNLATKIAASAMLLYAARPEFYVPARLPRAERYQFVGGAAAREHMMRMTFPGTTKFPMAKKVIVGGDLFGANGTTKSHHYRGWVLRTLRHEKYRRNPDGTLRVILVEPCEIHPELAEGAMIQRAG